ncbi:CHAT domain-containing protein [bacterium]|nr:CHAT domain-containing protein [bacterium]
MKCYVVLFILVSIPTYAADFTKELQEIDDLLKKGEYKEVLRFSDSVIQRADKENNWNAKGRALIYSAQASHSMGHSKEMKNFIENAIDVFKAHNDPAGLGRSYYVYSFYYLKNNNAEEMYRLLDIGKKYADKGSDIEVRIRILLGLGLASWNLGRFSDAINQLNEGAQLARENNQTHLLGLAHENLAMNYSARADFPQALENYRQAFAIFEQEKNPHAMGYVYGNMGVTYERMGDIENAMTLYEKSLEIHRKGDYRFGQGLQTENIAEAHHRLGHHDQAIEYSLKALELVRDEGQWIRAQFLENLADRYLSANNLEQAEFYANQANKELTDKANTRLLMHNHMLMARLELKRKSPNESLRWLDQAILLIKDMGDFYDLGICEGLKAQAYEQLNRLDEASDAYQQAISLHEKIHSYESVHNWYAALARLNIKNGDDNAAVLNFEKSLAAINTASDFIAMDRFRVDLFGESSRIYRSYASYLAQHGKAKEALIILEEGRARDLRLRVAQAQGMKNMSAEQTDLLGQIHQLQKQLSEAEIQPASTSVLYTRLQKSAVAYEHLRNSDGGARQNQLAQANDNTLFVEYALQENSLLVFSYQNGNTQFRVVNDAERIGNMAEKYFAFVSDRTKNFDRSLGQQLFKSLLEPELQNQKNINLIIIPDGSLFRLPFSALINSKDHFVVEDYSITYAPSINLFSRLRHETHSSSKRVLSLANSNFSGINAIRLPALPLATEEAKHVAKYGEGSQVVIDQTEKKVKNTDFSNYEIVHFATHTLIDEDRPERSSIIFKPGDGEDGFFRATDIYKLQIPSNMVVLSSCRSGSGKAVPGEGLLGLSHAFFSAGARSLVMTYWNVSDKTAQEFSERFYSNLDDRTIAEALRETQIKMIRSGDWNHPADWAAFFVEGDSQQKLQLKRPWNQTFLAILLLIIVFALLVVIYFRRERKKLRTAS